MWDAAATELLRQGILGIVCLAQSAVIIALWRSNMAKDERNSILQDERVADMKDVGAKAIESIHSTRAVIQTFIETHRAKR